MTADHVAVRIFGETYPLKTGQDPAYVEEIARFVDARMREVAASGKVVVTSKVAVLAALHIADELFRLKREATQEAPDLDERIRGLVETLDRALAAPAGGA